MARFIPQLMVCEKRLLSAESISLTPLSASPTSNTGQHQTPIMLGTISKEVRPAPKIEEKLAVSNTLQHTFGGEVAGASLSQHCSGLV